MLIGYARVTTQEQSVNCQKEASKEERLLKNLERYDKRNAIEFLCAETRMEWRLLPKERRKGMAESRNEKITEWLDIKLDSLSADDRLGLISEVMETLTAQELRRVRDTAESKSQEKFEDAKNAVLDEMRGKLAELGLTLDDVLSAPASMRKTRKGARGTVRVKYRGPQGETWSGRGQAPQWIKRLEEQGHTREEFFVQPDEQ